MSAPLPVVIAAAPPVIVTVLLPLPAMTMSPVPPAEITLTPLPAVTCSPPPLPAAIRLLPLPTTIELEAPAAARFTMLLPSPSTTVVPPPRPLLLIGGNRSYALFELGRVDEAIRGLRALGEELPPGLHHPVLSLLTLTLAADGQDRAALEVALGACQAEMSASTLARQSHRRCFSPGPQQGALGGAQAACRDGC